MAFLTLVHLVTPIHLFKYSNPSREKVYKVLIFAVDVLKYKILNYYGNCKVKVSEFKSKLQ